MDSWVILLLNLFVIYQVPSGVANLSAKVNKLEMAMQGSVMVFASRSADLEDRVANLSLEVNTNLQNMVNDNNDMKLDISSQLEDFKDSLNLTEHSVIQEFNDLKLEVHNGIKDLKNQTDSVVQELNDQSIKMMNQKIDHVHLLSTVAKNCWQLAQQGVQHLGEFNVDPDGPYVGETSIRVNCSFPDNSTSIGATEKVIIGKCDDERCFLFVVNYTAPLSQMKTLVSESSSCKQEIKIECKSAPMKADGKHLFSWLDVDGLERTLKSTVCDKNQPKWLAETHIIENHNWLPVTGIHYGPLLLDNEEAIVSIGPLICQAPPPDSWDQYSLSTNLQNMVNDNNDMKLDISSQLEDFKDSLNLTENSIIQEFNDMKSDVHDDIEDLKNQTDSAIQEFNDLKSEVHNGIEDLKIQTDSAVQAFNDMKSDVYDKIGDVESIVNDVKSYLKIIMLSISTDNSFISPILILRGLETGTLEYCSSTFVCLHGGTCYGRPDDLFGCRCQQNYYGMNCETPFPTTAVQKLERLTNINDCPGQDWFDFNQQNKDTPKEIVISNYRDDMQCWWFVTNSMNTGHMELTFQNFTTESTSYEYDLLFVYNGPSSSSPELHKLLGSGGRKTITWSKPFVSIYWKTDGSNTKSPMTGKLRYVP